MEAGMTKCFLGLGSSLGDRLSNLCLAAARLGEMPGTRLMRVSGVYETPPAGGVAKNPFLNAAVEIETALSPEEILEFIQGIEKEAGRVRRERWEDRTLDIDILLYGDMIIERGDVRIPHPRMAERRFVLTPLMEIAADTVDPESGLSVHDLCERCVDKSSALPFPGSATDKPSGR
jgi:2-amino-4-hydroxy-6-hydroxymethyldihydropteridine diphosphokinase